MNIAECLQSLPAAELRPDGWADVQSRLAARHAAMTRRAVAWRVAAAASVAVMAVTAAWRIGHLGLEHSRSVAAELTPLTAEQAVALDRVAQLRAQSAALEDMLSVIGERPAVQRAGTSVPIDSLEAQVQWLDHQLTVGQGEVEPAAVEQLWRQRVEVMNSLVRLRYVEAQRIDM
jgi:hypothetical protein